jgi:hypothetical protein
MTVRARPTSRCRADARQITTHHPPHEGVEVAKRCDHQSPLFPIDRDVMRQAVSFPGGLVVRQHQDGALSDEVRGGMVLA